MSIRPGGGASTGGTGTSGQGLPSTIVTKTSAYTAATGEFVLANAVAGGFTVTLPTAPATGALVTVKKTDATGNVVTIAPAGGGTIDGDANATVTSPQFGGIFEHAGSNVWKVVAPTSAGGSNGVNGNTVLSGAGAPGSGTGVNGDFYLDTTNTRLYGPKAAGAWPGGYTSLIGAAGTNGAISQLQDEGSNLTVRGTVNFVGAGVTATDDAANSRTLVTIPGGSTTTPLNGTGFKTGFYYWTPGATWTALGLANGDCEVGFFNVPVATTFDRIGALIWTAGASGSLVRLGIYNVGSDGMPSTLVLDAGTINGTTAAGAAQFLTISQALPAGLYALVQAGQGAPATAPQPMKWSIAFPGLTPLAVNAADVVSTNQGPTIKATGITGALPSNFPTAVSAMNIGTPRISMRAA